MPLEHHLPVDSTEPLVVLDLLWSTWGAAHPQRSVSTEEGSDEISGLWLDVRWEFVISVHDLLIDADGIVVVERRVSSEHLENENTESPPVDVLVVAF